MNKQLNKAIDKCVKAFNEYIEATNQLNSVLNDKIQNFKEEMDKHIPRMLDKNDCGHAIIKYHKYSDDFIEFETSDNKYRYVTTGMSNKYTFPIDTLSCMTVTDRKFQVYSYLTHKYEDIGYVKRIELLEGVNEYDQN